MVKRLSAHPSRQEIRSIYARNQGIQIHGLKIHRLCLNRHLPKVDRIAAHTHPYSQLLMYLAGGGRQKIAGQSYVIGRGSLFFIPPRTPHSFVDTHAFKPLCLAVDFEWQEESRTASTAVTLTAFDLKRVRQELAFLTRWRTGSEVAEPREAAAALRLIDLCFRALHFLSRESLPTESNLVATVQRTLRDPAAWTVPLTHLARRIGYQPDYLNRLLKPACGLTLGELRDTARLHAAQQLLARSVSVAEACSQTGFSDPNYFSRWFRVQTGRTPTAWRTGQA